MRARQELRSDLNCTRLRNAALSGLRFAELIIIKPLQFLRHFLALVGLPHTRLNRHIPGTKLVRKPPFLLQQSLSQLVQRPLLTESKTDGIQSAGPKAQDRSGALLAFAAVQGFFAFVTGTDEQVPSGLIRIAPYKVYLIYSVEFICIVDHLAAAKRYMVID